MTAPGATIPPDETRSLEPPPSHGGLLRVFADIRRERDMQDRRWGIQNHSIPHWFLILLEEVGEANRAALEREVLLRDGPRTGEHNRELDAAGFHLREELIQVAAVAANIVEFLDRIDLHSRMLAAVNAQEIERSLSSEHVDGYLLALQFERDEDRRLVACNLQGFAAHLRRRFAEVS